MRGDMILVYQLFHDLINILVSLFFTPPPIGITRGHNFKIFKPHTGRWIRSDFLVIVLLLGDYNLPNINWATLTSLEGDQSLSTNFLNACEDGFLTQHVSKPTRHRHGQNSSLLDLVFTTDPDMIEDGNINHLPPLAVVTTKYYCGMLFAISMTIAKILKGENGIIPVLM